MDRSKQARSQELSMRRRAMGLMKKTDELSTLCGVDACLIISGVKVDGLPVKPFFWPPNTEKIKSVFNRYKGYSMKSVTRKTMKFSTRAMKKKTSEGSKKAMEKKTSSEVKQITDLQNLSVAQLQEFVKNCDAGLEALRRRMDEVRQEKMQVDKP